MKKRNNNNANALQPRNRWIRPLRGREAARWNERLLELKKSKPRNEAIIVEAEA